MKNLIALIILAIIITECREFFKAKPVSQEADLNELLLTLDHLQPPPNYSANEAQECFNIFKPNFQAQEQSLRQLKDISEERIARELDDTKDSVNLACSLNFDLDLTASIATKGMQAIGVPVNIISILENKDAPELLRKFSVIHYLKKQAVLIDAASTELGRKTLEKAKIDKETINIFHLLSNEASKIVIERKARHISLNVSDNSELPITITSSKNEFNLSDLARYSRWRAIPGYTKANTIISEEEIGIAIYLPFIIIISDIYKLQNKKSINYLKFIDRTADRKECKLNSPIGLDIKKSNFIGCYNKEDRGIIISGLLRHATKGLGKDAGVVFHELIHSVVENAANNNPVIAEGIATALTEKTMRTFNAAEESFKDDPERVISIWNNFQNGILTNSDIQLSEQYISKQSISPELKKLSCALIKDKRKNGNLLMRIGNVDTFQNGTEAAIQANYGLSSLLFYPLIEKNREISEIMRDLDMRAAQLELIYKNINSENPQEENRSKLAMLELEAKKYARSVTECQ